MRGVGRGAVTSGFLGNSSGILGTCLNIAIDSQLPWLVQRVSRIHHVNYFNLVVAGDALMDSRRCDVSCLARAANRLANQQKPTTATTENEAHNRQNSL